MVFAGFDFSAGSGDTILTTNMMKPSMQQAVAAQLAPFKAAGLLPAIYETVVPLHSQSETYAAGPQVNYRHFRAFTLFAHPDLGAIHEAATPHPGDAIGRALVMQLAPSGIKRDWTYFYGFGGGVDVNLMRHFGLRVNRRFCAGSLILGSLKLSEFRAFFGRPRLPLWRQRSEMSGAQTAPNASCRGQARLLRTRYNLHREKLRARPRLAASRKNHRPRARRFGGTPSVRRCAGLPPSRAAAVLCTVARECPAHRARSVGFGYPSRRSHRHVGLQLRRVGLPAVCRRPYRLRTSERQSGLPRA